jgi:low affinity Fe/Cu permease
MIGTKAFTAFASFIARAAGRPSAFALCLAVILAWAVSGPFFHFSDTWQLIINTDTTIVTFLMVFLIQNTQNRDGAAIQAKLDELIRASAAQNRFIGIESLTEEELTELRARFADRSQAGKLDLALEAAEAAEERADLKAREAARQASGMASYPD